MHESLPKVRYILLLQLFLDINPIVHAFASCPSETAFPSFLIHVKDEDKVMTRCVLFLHVDYLLEMELIL